MKRIVFTLALLISFVAAVPAHAQHLQVPGTPTALIHDNVTGADVTVGIWAQHNLIVGDYLILAEKTAAGWVGVWVDNPQYPNYPASVAADPVAFIRSKLPAINGALANRYALPSGGPQTTGSAATDAVNQALYMGFKFKVMPDGAVAVVAF